MPLAMLNNIKIVAIIAIVLSILASTALAVPNMATRLACQKLSQNLPDKVFPPAQKQYIKENKDYWNAGLQELGPACVAIPSSAQDVSKIVILLNEHEKVPFAIKNGGHSPNAGMASVKDGILIALRNVAGTEYDTEKQVAYIKPGGHWTEPTDALAKYGRTVVGGRLGSIGLGGYLTQGGLSFLSAQHELAADNIIEWETVLANGTIANIKASERPELASAMRGGGDQFGIVTSFTIKTYPQGDIWAGFKMFAYKDREKVFEALADFVENNHKNQKAAIIFASGFGESDLLTAGMLLVYDGPSPPKGAFRKFEDIPCQLSLGTSMRYTTLIKLTDPFMSTLSYRASFRSFTLPHQPEDHSFYKRIDDTWSGVAKKYIGSRWNIFNFVIFQPFPKSIGAASDARGGNAMGLSGTDHDRFVLEIATIWTNKAEDDLVKAMVRDITATLSLKLSEDKSKAKTSGRIIGDYNPFYMNDAGPDQDVMSSFKDAKKFAKLQKDMDPTGLWAKRAGGYKHKESTGG